MTLAERFKAGELAAVEEVYRHYGQLVLTVAWRMLRQTDLAEEAAQEAFLRAWRAADRLDVERDLAPWLTTITQRIAIDIFRREQRRAHLDLTVVDSEASSVVHPPDAERLDAIWQTRRAIDVLPSDERLLVELHHRHDLTHQQIATRLGLPIGTVKSRLFRAHRRLATLLAPRLNAPVGAATLDATVLGHGRREAHHDGQPDQLGQLDHSVLVGLVA